MTWHSGDPVALLLEADMITVVLLLLVGAFVLTILAAMGKVQLWIGVMLLTIAALLGAMAGGLPIVR